MEFTVLRVPFFLEPDYPEGPEFEETNRVRLVRKWGGQEGWDAWGGVKTIRDRGAAAAATWIFRGDESRRCRGGDETRHRRGRDVDLPWG